MRRLPSVGGAHGEVRAVVLLAREDTRGYKPHNHEDAGNDGDDESICTAGRCVAGMGKPAAPLGVLLILLYLNIYKCLAEGFRLLEEGLLLG